MLKMLKGLRRFNFVRNCWRNMKSFLKERRLNSIIAQQKAAGLLINIGAGAFVRRNWVNLDYVSEWYRDVHRGTNFIPYDIRHDSVPLDDETVFCAYCSHVIEHIENRYIGKMFKETYRILKKNGIFRLTFPDSKFLYNATLSNQDFWFWRMEWFNSEKYVNQPIQSISNIDFLVREIATPKSRFYRYAQNPIDEETLKLSFERFSRKEFTDFLTENLEFRSDYPGDHINWWDFEKCKLYLEEAGFSHIIESKYTGSMTPHMCGRDFDQTEPRMSCYVEAIK